MSSSVEQDRAARGREAPADQVEQRRFAGAVRSDDRVTLAAAAMSSETPRMIGVAPKRFSTPRSSSALRRHAFASARARSHAAATTAPRRAEQQEAAAERGHRDDPRPRRCGIDRRPQEAHPCAELRLRREAVAHLDKQDRDPAAITASGTSASAYAPRTPPNARVRAIGRCCTISPARPAGANRIISDEEDAEIEQPRRRVAATGRSAAT